MMSYWESMSMHLGRMQREATCHHREGSPITVLHGDCLDALRADRLGYDYRLGYFPPAIPDASVDSVVTDPPYGIGFMGKAWDAKFIDSTIEKRRQYNGDPSERAGENGGYRSAAAEAGRYDQSASANRNFQEWCEAWARECFRVLKPGGHLLASGGSRTWHRLTAGIEDAGFEIRDSIAWLYGSGFPKSLDVSKAIDRAAGAEREPGVQYVAPDGKPRGTDLGIQGGNFAAGEANYTPTKLITAPATDAARTWQGWGTALKPAFEPIVVARKPLSGTVAANVLTHGTGALNIDGCRVASSEADKAAINAKHAGMDAAAYERPAGTSLNLSVNPMALKPAQAHDLGRWPANVVLDESQAAALDEQSGESMSRIGKPRGADHGDGWGMTATGAEYDDQGGASRFFYVAKADASERVRVNGTAHPTVKPLALMRWLVRLVTPPGGTVLEPFAGSGTTVEACILEGFKCIAIEREADYLPLIQARIARRRDPVKAVELAGEDGGLFDLLDGGAA